MQQNKANWWVLLNMVIVCNKSWGARKRMKLLFGLNYLLDLFCFLGQH